MSDDLDQLLDAVEALYRQVGELRGGRPGRGPEAVPDGDMAAALSTVERSLTDASAREGGLTAAFMLVEYEDGQEVSSVTSTMSEPDMERTLMPESELAQFASAMGNPARLRILRTLLMSPRSSAELAEETGLAGGQLYHHLRNLMHMGLVRQEERNLYVIEPGAGRVAYLGFNLLARTFRQFRTSDMLDSPGEE